jgi:NitT/TauT family transport system substrate-binding protein
VRAGEGVRFSTTEDFFPNAQIALLYFGEKFASGKSDIGKRFMRAYVRAARDYNDAIVEGRFSSDANAQRIVATLAAGLNMKEADVRQAYVQALDPDARPNIEALRRDVSFFRQTGALATEPDLAKLVDTSFVESAVQELGTYVRKDRN